MLCLLTAKMTDALLPLVLEWRTSQLMHIRAKHGGVSLGPRLREERRQRHHNRTSYTSGVRGWTVIRGWIHVRRWTHVRGWTYSRQALSSLIHHLRQLPMKDGGDRVGPHTNPTRSPINGRVTLTKPRHAQNSIDWCIQQVKQQ